MTTVNFNHRSPVIVEALAEKDHVRRQLFSVEVRKLFLAKELVGHRHVGLGPPLRQVGVDPQAVPAKVWSLTQFYSVDFSQSRISVKSAFSTKAKSRFASVVVDSVLGPPRLAWHTSEVESPKVSL